MKLTLLLIALTCIQAYNPRWLNNVHLGDTTMMSMGKPDNSVNKLGFQHYVYIFLLPSPHYFLRSFLTPIPPNCVRNKRVLMKWMQFK